MRDKRITVLQKSERPQRETGAFQQDRRWAGLAGNVPAFYPNPTNSPSRLTWTVGQTETEDHDRRRNARHAVNVAQTGYAIFPNNSEDAATGQRAPQRPGPYDRAEATKMAAREAPNSPRAIRQALRGNWPSGRRCRVCPQSGAKRQNILSLWVRGRSI